MKNAHTPGPWKVVPCPIHAGKHPCHDARWIMTADANVEMSDYVPNDWALSQGSIVCQMRDRDPRDARLIAAAPELLAALDGILQWWAEMGGDFDVDDMPAELWDNAHAALKKACRRDPR